MLFNREEVKMKKNKILSIVLAGVLALAGCNTGGDEVVLHRAYGAPHGDKGFSRVVVATVGDEIIDVALDEFQYLNAESAVGVPNSDGSFGEGSVEGVVLASKVENDDLYSGMMENAGSTVSIADNYAAIEEFAKGKTISELEEVANAATAGEPIDAVSGATLTDTKGYLQAIIDAAKDDSMTVTATVADSSTVELKAGQGAPHGDKSFGDAVVLVDGDTIVAASIDEFQYFGGEGVPNSDGSFGESYADAVLVSKWVNDEAYSAAMANAGSTKNIAEGYITIVDYAAGKTISEVGETAAEGEGAVDTVSGATLVDTAGYLQMIVNIANK